MPKKAESEIRKRIQKNNNPHDIQQLCLDGIQINTITPTIKRLLEGCTNLSYLTMNNCQLRNLNNFPHLKNLIALELSENKLTGEDLSKLRYCIDISFLMLDNNLINSISYVSQLTPLTQLEILQIHDNQICETQNYRELIFEMFPKMNIVDYHDREGNMAEGEDEQQYISNIGNSRLDLLELLQNDQHHQKVEVANLDIQQVEGNNLKRRYSLETSPSPCPNQTHLVNSTQLDRFQRQKEIMLIRTNVSYESQSEEEDHDQDLLGFFKRKLNKKQQE